jgi:hypothetical protein
MGWIEFFSTVIGNILSWPVAFIIAVLILRRPLRDFIRSVESFVLRWGAAEFTFQRKLQDVRQRLDEVEGKTHLPTVNEPEDQLKGTPIEPESSSEGSPTMRLPDPDTLRHLNFMVEQSKQQPLAAVITAWEMVEAEARELARLKDIKDKDGLPAYRANRDDVFRELARQGVVPQSLLESVADLAYIRNQAIHDQSKLTQSQALDFVALAARAAGILRGLRPSRDDS